MTIDRAHSDPTRPSSTGLTRRQLLKFGGVTLGALSLGRQAWAQAPKPGGSFISAQSTEATGLDPQLVPAFSRSRRSPMMYNQLIRFDGDMNPVPELAESWQISPDGLAWTFKLRQGVKFHDGQEMTSADVKFTFDRLFEKSPGKSDFVAVDRVEPAGRYAVKFLTKEPFAGLLAALGGFWGFIISEAGIKKHGDLNKAALGTGPFMLEDWKVEQQMSLKKHPNYFRKGLRVRQAISWTVDRSQVMRVAASGFGRLTAPATAPMKQWQLPEEQWMRYYKPDVDKAKKLMADAGVGSGFTVKLGVIPTFPTMVSGAPVVAAQLKRIGITAEIENVEYAVWIKRWLAKDFDMTMNTTPGYADPDTAFFRALHSTKGQNWNSWSVPELDAALELGRRTMDPKKRKEIYDRVQIMILENVPHLWLFSAERIDFTQASVKGFRQHPTTLLYNFEDVWLDKA